MKLDKGKPYGTIWGHSQAVYEQNGRLFDGAGEVVEPTIERELFDNNEGENVREFIQAMLKEGPIAQANLYKEAESRAIPWEEVKKIAAEMGVRQYKRAHVQTWSLIGE